MNARGQAGALADGPFDERQALQRARHDLRANRLGEAEAALEAVIRHNPRCPEAWDGLGIAAFQSNRMERAESAFRRALALKPSAAETKVYLAATLRRRGQVTAALSFYEEAATALPGDAALHNNWGNALGEAGRLEEGIKALRRAVELAPGSELFRVNLAKVLLKDKHHAEAVVVLEPAIAMNPGSGAVLAEYGNALLGLERYHDAIDAFRAARRNGYEDGGMLHNLGTALEYVGAMLQAEEAYRAAIAADPKLAISRRQLAYLRKAESPDQDIADLKAQLARSGPSIGDRAEIYLGLAKAFDDIGDYEQAFESLQAGNQLIRTTINYSAEADTEFADAMLATFDEAFLAERAEWGIASERPIFVLGMPRSGTTLTEQILSSHPSIFGAGELMKVSQIIAALRRRLSPDLAMQRVAPRLTSAAIRAAAESYLSHLAGLDQSAPRVTDKMPFNFRYLGFIALMFPNARIIHCVRHPLDVAMSCYFARFHDNLTFSFNLREIAHYYRNYERLMEHWARVIRNPMLTVAYEYLVADQERETRRMLAFCGLEWDERCLTFHRNERPIVTASSSQVRQPIYQSSVGRWRHYHEHLRPLLTTLGMQDPDVWRPPAASSDGKP